MAKLLGIGICRVVLVAEAGRPTCCKVILFLCCCELVSFSTSHHWLLQKCGGASSYCISVIIKCAVMFLIVFVSVKCLVTVWKRGNCEHFVAS